nr:zinc finger, CCHC-type [Tanacetum cinerariifolium]
MQIILEANGLWEMIEPNEKTKSDNKKDKTAITFLYQALPEEQLLQITKHKTAKAIWDALKARHIGEERVQQARLQTLKSDFEMLHMKKDETIDTFTTKITALVNNAASLGHTMEDGTLVRKLLNAVPDSESLDGGVTKSMNQPGIREDTYTKRTSIERQSVELARITLYVIMSPQSSVFFVHVKDITRLRSAWLSIVRGPACIRVMLLGRHVSLSDVWVMGRASPYYSVDNEIVAVSEVEGKGKKGARFWREVAEHFHEQKWAKAKEATILLITNGKIGFVLSEVEGKGKKAARFWREVAEHFHEEIGEDKRSYDPVNYKWKNWIRPKLADSEDVEAQEVPAPMGRDRAKKKGSSSRARSKTSIACDPSLVDALLSKFTMAATPLFTQRKELSSVYL